MIKVVTLLNTLRDAMQKARVLSFQYRDEDYNLSKYQTKLLLSAPIMFFNCLGGKQTKLTQKDPLTLKVKIREFRGFFDNKTNTVHKLFGHKNS